MACKHNICLYRGRITVAVYYVRSGKYRPLRYPCFSTRWNDSLLFPIAVYGGASAPYHAKSAVCTGLLYVEDRYNSHFVIGGHMNSHHVCEPKSEMGAANQQHSRRRVQH